MQKLWIVPSYEGAGALKSLILNLNELVEANIVTHDALFVEAPDEYADLIQRVATQAEMLVSKESEIEPTEITGALPWRATLGLNWNGKEPVNVQEPLMLPETHVGYTGIPGKINKEALLKDSETSSNQTASVDKKIEVAALTDPGHSEPVCQNCGKAFIPRRKNSKFCDREDCEKDRKRKYAKKYYDARDKPKAETVQEEDEMKAGFAAEAPLASSLSADEIVYYPYEIMDGENQGRRLDGPTLGVWLRIGRLPLGTMVKHVKRGMHIVVRKEGRKTAILSKVYQYNSEVKP